MELLIVYRDEVSYNPIVYIGVIDKNKDKSKAIAEQVRAAKRVECISMTGKDINEIVMNLTYDLTDTYPYTWYDETYCFSIKKL